MTGIDFAAIFAACPAAHLLLDTSFTIVDANTAYLRVTRTRHEDIVGRHVFDAFPDNPDDPGADGTRNLRASLERVRDTAKPDTMARQRYDLRGPDGVFEERWWSPVNTPVLGPDGAVRWILHQVDDVTELVRLERARRDQDAVVREAAAASEERYGLLLDSAPDAIVVVDTAGLISLVNVQTERLFGYSRGELLGKSLELLIPERVRTSHAKHVEAFFASTRTRAMGAGLELFGRRRDGSEVPIEVSLSPLRTAAGTSVSAAIRDITDRKRIEALAKLNADRLASAFEGTEEALALFDGKDELVLCNSVYRRLLESVEGPLVGRRYTDLLEAWLGIVVFRDDVERDRFRDARLSDRGRPTATFDVRTTDGRSLRVKERRTSEGGTLETVWDLTEDVERAEELREARLAADVASHAKTEFLSSMSHELRTPLNAVLGFAQLLQRDKKEPLSQRHKERVEQILKGGEHLLRLIDDILDLSRIEGGSISISTEPVSVMEVVEEVRTTLDPVASRATVRLSIADGPTALPVISADRTRFSQILLNYGSNAIKYNRAGGRVEFRVSQPTPSRVRVSVVDDGWGIPLDKQDKVFLPFQRAGQETGPIEGTGIGLTITKRLAELMRGDVGFESTPSQGSEFWVELPVHVGTAPAAHASSSEPTPRLDGTRRGLVLYVEDNPANVTFMRHLLDVFDGIDLEVAPTAEIGVELARERRPDVIVMDINLPGMSGLDALNALRRFDETRDIPVIALTAAASERDRDRGERAGFARYLTKPVNVAELEAALDRYLTKDR
jgi:PAS domain S-box-containing protein